MKLIVDRVCLVVLALTAALVGVWAYFAPTSWYDNFPGFGLRWLPPLGPYNEHLAKDVGAMYLALLVLTVAALWRPSLVRLTGAVWLVFNVLHLVYHMTMLSMYEPRDQVLNVIALSLVVVMSVVLILPGGAGRPSR